MRSPREHPIGPWLVALGAGLWTTEGAWRIPLADVFSVDVAVLWEHVILVICALPLVIPRLGELRRVQVRTVAWLMFSGVAGAAVGAVLLTEALEVGDPTVARVALNAQPVLSTVAACLIAGDRLARTFYPWAMLAVVAGMVVSLAPGRGIAVDAGTGYALLCALLWGLSTVAGRAVMVEMSLPLAAGLRVIVGLATMTVIVAARGELVSDALWPVAAAAAPVKVVIWLVLLATLSSGVPLLVYFKGLELTRASTAGYFELVQAVVAVVVAWAVFHAELMWHQVVAAVALIGAVVMVQRAQAHTALPFAPGMSVTGPPLTAKAPERATRRRARTGPGRRARPRPRGRRPWPRPRAGRSRPGSRGPLRCEGEGRARSRSAPRARGAAPDRRPIGR